MFKLNRAWESIFKVQLLLTQPSELFSEFKAGLIALVLFQNQTGFTTSQVQNHLCEKTIRPRKPTSGIIRLIIDGLRLVY